MSTTNDSEFMEQPPTALSETPRQNPKWLGLVMALFLPGSAHFLAGQRRTGVFWFLVCWLLPFPLLFYFLASLPGMGFFYVAVGFFVIDFLLWITMLITSWRPTRRIGYSGGLLLIGIVLSIHCLAAYFVGNYISLSKTHVAETYAMTGMSMAPTLIAPSESAPEVKQADYIITNKWTYRRSDPARGDIVTFNTADWHKDSPTIFVKRVVGLPGETVDIEPPYVLINGERLTSPPIFAKISARQDGFTGYCTAEEAGGEGVVLPLTLGPDEYFLMGDHSPCSHDSRFNGPVSRHNITGRTIRIYYPFDRIRELE